MPIFSFVQRIASAPDVKCLIYIIHKAINLSISVIHHLVSLCLIMSLLSLCDLLSHFLIISFFSFLYFIIMYYYFFTFRTHG